MTIAKIEPVNQRGQIRTGELRRLGRESVAQDRVTTGQGRANSLAAGRTHVARNAAGFQLDTASPLEIWARITGPPAGTPPRHPWRQQVQTGPGTWIDYDQGLLGTTAANDFPAYELNNLGDDLTDSRELLYQGLGDFFVFAHGSGSGGTGGIFARIASRNCPAGSFTLVEIEPIAAGAWQDRPGGVANATAYHFQKGVGPFAAGGPLVEVGTRVRAWRGHGDDWRFDGPAGFTGTEEYVARWRCVNNRAEVLTKFRVLWNGLQIRASCHDTTPSSVCTPCTADPP